MSIAVAIVVITPPWFRLTASQQLDNGVSPASGYWLIVSPLAEFIGSLFSAKKLLFNVISGLDPVQRRSSSSVISPCVA